MSASPRAQLLARSPQHVAAGAVLFVGWNTDDLLHLHENDCLPRGSAVTCTHFGEYEVTRRHAESLGISQVAFDLPDSRANAFELAVVDLPQGREAREMGFHRIAALLAESGSVLVAGETRSGIKPARTALGEMFASVETLDNARRCALVRATQRNASLAVSTDLEPWFTEQAFTVADTTVTVCSLPGVFSHGELDHGTQLLLETLVDDVSMNVLDVGCGCGIIGAWLHQREPGRRVEMIDCDALALTAAKRTAQRNNLPTDAVYASDVYDQVSESFDLIVSNPPFHRGVNTAHDVGERLVTEAVSLLNPGGRLRFVANSFLPYPRLLDAHFPRWKTIEDDGKFRVYEVRVAAASRR
ncbi:MAG: methyltransferase [Phycisphaerales bacterium]|nr:methyltransferase [Phycisphaerales bacterium]